MTRKSYVQPQKGELEEVVTMTSQLSLCNIQSSAKSLSQLAQENNVEALAKELKRLDGEGKLSSIINEADAKKLTPLHYAARLGNSNAMKVLIGFGADVNAEDGNGMTAVHYTARYRRKPVKSPTVNPAKVQSARKKGKASRKRRESKKPARMGAEDESTWSISPSHDHEETELDEPSELDDAKGSFYDQFRFKRVSNSVVISDIVEEAIPDVAEEFDFFAFGGNLNKLDSQGFAPLHIAAMKGNLFSIKSLLSKPDVQREITNKGEQRTALHLATMYNQPEAVKMLLERGLNPRMKDSELKTPLHLAAKEGNDKVVEVFVRECQSLYGDEFITNLVQDEDTKYETPLLVAIKSSNVSIVKKLMPFFNKSIIHELDRFFPTHSAAITGSIDMLDILLQYGASISSLNASNKAPLYIAAENNIVEVIKFLIDNGADVNQECVLGRTALMVAAKEGSLEAVKFLLDRRAIIDLSDDESKSAVYYAAMNGRQEILKELLDTLDGKLLMDDNDKDGKTPMHIAAEKGQLEAVSILIEAGSSVDRKDNRRRRPIHLAAENGFPEVIEVIIKYDRNSIMSEDDLGNSPLHSACRNNCPKSAEMLLKYGAAIDVHNSLGLSPLAETINSNSPECAKVLLENHASVESKCKGRTAICYAAQLGRHEIVKLLLEFGADITTRDQDGLNSLCYAVRFEQKKCASLILATPKWKEAMRNCIDSEHYGSIVPNTPFRMMIRIVPELAKVVLDRCCIVSEDSLDIDYEFLDDSYNFVQNSGIESRGQKYNHLRELDSIQELKISDSQYHRNGKVVMSNHPLMIMVEEGQMELLRDPVCIALLSRKWNQYGRYIYYANLVTYLGFLAMLTTFSLVTTNPGGLNATCTEAIYSLGHIKEPLQGICQLGIITLAVLNLVLEGVQLLRSRRQYLQWHNLFDWLIYGLAIFVVIDIRDGSNETGLRTCWQWQVGALVVTMAWLNLLSVIRQLPLLGIYVIMFFDILRTFFKFAFVFIIFIISFGLGFHILLKNQTPFAYVGTSFLKTSIMMIGEFEYEGIFHSEEAPQYPVITYLLFLLFLVIMSIIIVNLLVGLAVDDIKAVQDQAVLKRLAMQVETVLDVERMIPNVFLRKFVIRKDIRLPISLLKESKRLDNKEAASNSAKDKKDKEQREQTQILERLSDELEGLKAMMKDSMKAKKADDKNVQLSTLPPEAIPAPVPTSTLIAIPYDNDSPID